MPRPQGGIVYGRSMLSPTGAANEVTAELDFQLAAGLGIEIFSVMGWGNLHDDSPAVSDTVPFTAIAHQSLHREAGETEDLPDAAGEDAFDIDTEVFWNQFFVQQGVMGSTVTFGASASLTVMPSGITVFERPVLSARNITHKAVTIGADQDLECGILFEYRYVKFSQAELGALFARF